MTLFAPHVRDSQVAALFAAALCAALAMGAGIGGGGLFVPLLILVLNKNVVIATSMSQCLIAGAALAGLLYNLNQRHPLRDRPLIDVSLVLFLSPLQMAGALCGNVLNRMLPPVILIVVMVIVLSVSDVKTLIKGWKLWKKESCQHKLIGDTPTLSTMLSLDNSQINTIQEGKLCGKSAIRNNSTVRRMFQRWANYVSSKMGHCLVNKYYLRPCFEPYFQEKGEDVERWPLTQSGRNQELIKSKFFMEKESRHNLLYWYTLGAVWMITLLLIFIRGGKGADSIFGVPYCGVAYWFVTFIAMVILSTVSIVMLRRLVQESDEKKRCGYVFAEGDVVWTRSNGIHLAMVTVLAGIVAGLIGIGGGMVIGPILLELGFNPQVSSALTATNVLMSSSSVSMLVLMSGAAPIDEALFYGFICFVGAFFGKNFLGRLIKRLGKTSVIIFILGGVIFLAIVAVLVQGIFNFSSTGIDLTVKNVCS